MMKNYSRVPESNFIDQQKFILHRGFILVLFLGTYFRTNLNIGIPSVTILKIFQMAKAKAKALQTA